jgi:hypothetical protein
MVAMDTPAPQQQQPHEPLLTVGALARELGEPLHRVRYCIDAYGIEPTPRAGVLRRSRSGSSWSLLARDGRTSTSGRPPPSSIK